MIKPSASLVFVFVLISFCVNAQAPAAEPDTTVYKIVDVRPEFNGGMENMPKWLAKNLRYPNYSTQGKVTVEFVVNKDGSRSNIRVTKSLNEECDKEAVRIIGKMPPWAPGTKKGKIVRAWVLLPISFGLNR